MARRLSANSRAGDGRDGERSLLQNPGSAMFGEQAWAEISRGLNLSGRELQIVRGIFDDRIEIAIAADIGISPHTVRTHLRRLHRKLGVTNRVQLILRITNEFLALPPVHPQSPLPVVSAAGTTPSAAPAC
jgi:DNA-binding CsgD family transcriptional regulator